MLGLSPATQVFLAVGATDMRKSIDRLALLVEAHLALSPLSGHLFAFCNRRRTIVKVLYWDRNGFCLWQKRLEKDVFRWPETKTEVLEIGSQELQWLLAGLEVVQSKAHRRLRYESTY